MLGTAPPGGTDTGNIDKVKLLPPPYPLMREAVGDRGPGNCALTTGVADAFGTLGWGIKCGGRTTEPVLALMGATTRCDCGSKADWERVGRVGARRGLDALGLGIEGL